jgi:hypothetical protein
MLKNTKDRGKFNHHLEKVQLFQRIKNQCFNSVTVCVISISLRLRPFYGEPA